MRETRIVVRSKADRRAWLGTEEKQMSSNRGGSTEKQRVSIAPGRRRLTMSRIKAVLVVALLLSASAIFATVLLQRDSDASRRAQLDLASVKLDLATLQDAPFRSSESTGGSPELARGLLREGKARVAQTLSTLDRDSPASALTALAPLLRRDYAVLERIYQLGVVHDGYGREADRLSGVATGLTDQTSLVLDRASGEYSARASRARTRAEVGAAAVILTLLAAFAFYFVRAAKTAEENERLLESAREDSLTDALTGLRNRRALMSDIEEQFQAASTERPLVLCMFDLDGFKYYNDTFGHPAGDSLLVRLGQRFQERTAETGTAYRLGGDEFCLLAPVTDRSPTAIAKSGARALSELGDAFTVGCSYGVVRVPVEAQQPEEALRTADRRLYSNKESRISASRQSIAVLNRVLDERGPGLVDHGDAVSELALPVAERLGVPSHEVDRIRMAAELHDVGKSAIPDTILLKPSKLSDDEWEFMRQHTVIGERIVQAAPSLAPAADLVRSSHENFDGTGYPDGLKQDEIPLGARIIYACDAFDVMTSERPYSPAISSERALAELRRCAGTQFDPCVVEVLCEFVQQGEIEPQPELDSVVV
jgi:diguanylate cyclase (GGDEF)-like protein